MVARGPGPRSKRSSRAGRVGLLVLSTLVALLLAEGVTRLLPPSFPSSATNGYRCDDELGWRGVPDSTVEVQRPEGSSHLVTRNSRGMHDREHSWNKSPGAFRILFVGDSFVESSHTPDDATMARQLESALNASQPAAPIEIIAAGVGGWGPTQELLYLEQEGRRYEPDLLLLSFYPYNDVSDILPALRYQNASGHPCGSPFLSICRGELDPTPWYASSFFLWRACSDLARAGDRAWFVAERHSRLLERVGSLVRRPRQFAGGLDYADALLAGIYDSFTRIAKESGARVAAYIVPYRQQVEEETDTPTFPAESTDQAGRIAWEVWSSHFASLMRGRRTPLLELHPEFVEAARSECPELFWADSHWNEAGSAVAARAIARWLNDERLIPAIARPERLSLAAQPCRRTGPERTKGVIFSTSFEASSPSVPSSSPDASRGRP